MIKKVLLEKSEKKYLPGVCIVGFRFSKVEPVVVKHKKDDLKLKVEGGNKFDENAVGVYVADKRIAFIAKDSSAAVRAYLEKYGEPTRITVCNIFPQSAQVNFMWAHEANAAKLLPVELAKCYFRRQGIEIPEWMAADELKKVDEEMDDKILGTH